MVEKKSSRRKSAGRKISGGRYKREKKKRKDSLIGQQNIVKLGVTKRKNIRIIGGNVKTILLRADEINLIDTKSHKSKKSKILNVIETPSNRFLARQNVLTKGAIIQTEAGKAKITNRPSQEGSVQGILIE